MLNGMGQSTNDDKAWLFLVWYEIHSSKKRPTAKDVMVCEGTFPPP
jgi:hypothetical protein